MAGIGGISAVLCVVLCCLTQGVMASGSFDFGDFLALCLGIFISVVGVLACLGAHSRKLVRENYY